MHPPDDAPRRPASLLAARRPAASAFAVLAAAFLVLAGSGCRERAGAASADEHPLPAVALREAFPGLTFTRPVGVTHAGDGTGRLFVIEQGGRVLVFANDPAVRQASLFVDLSPRVLVAHNEEGLLALAFHPGFEQNGRFFVYYTAGEPRRGVLAELAASGAVADPVSERILLEVEKPWGNHNGATLAFGPDGYLYVSIGDGGSANDPLDHGQDLGALLGSILRIDVDQRTEGRPYAVPPDNPFVGRPGARSELWAKGLRNVWRMSFDRTTGDLWAGDVGQNEWEEIDLIVRGGNYGWRLREGAHPFGTSEHPQPDPIDPVVEYSHDEGGSVTGGFVYRGSRYASLQGIYFYADYVSGHVYGLRHADGPLQAHARVCAGRWGRHVTSFGEDEAGELYVCAFDHLDGSEGGSGRIYRLEPE